MKETILYKIKRLVYHFIAKITGHKYGCCMNVFENCNRCKNNRLFADLGESE